MSKVKHHYDQVADIYDGRYDGERGRQYHTHICDHLMTRIPKGAQLLDLGCGTGLFTHRYIQAGGRAVGLDISRGMLSKARDRCRQGEYIAGTAEVLPFRDSCFDVVSSMLAFSYIRNPGALLAEAWRVLRPGGHIAICTLGRNLLTTAVPVVYHVWERLGVRQVGVGTFDEHYYTERELAGLLRDAGFCSIHSKYCSFAHHSLPDPLFALVKKVEPFVEKSAPYLAYNICASGIKPEEETAGES